MRRVVAAVVKMIVTARRNTRQETAPIPFSSQIETSIEERVAGLDPVIRNEMRLQHVPGLSIALLHDGKLAWAKGYGVANSVTRRAVKPWTPFEAASLGKMLTAYAALKLVNEDRLNLERPLDSYLNEKFIEDDHYRNHITLRTVLTHTSGLSNDLMESHHRIGFSPGSRFSYSGVGFMYLQKVVEELTCQPFNTYMTKTIFTPLGMSSSSYFRSSAEQMSRGHVYIAGVATPMPFFPTAQSNAANLLCSTASDLARFEAELMNLTLVSAKLVMEMLSPQVHVDGDVSWGLGIGLYRAGSSTCFWHWGDNIDFESYMIGYPDKKIGVVVMTNSSRGLSVARKIAARALGD